MILGKSVFTGSARKLFMTFFALSSLLPVLIVVYLIGESIFPFIDASHVVEITNEFTYVLLAVLLLPLCGFLVHR